VLAGGSAADEPGSGAAGVEESIRIRGMTFVSDEPTGRQLVVRAARARIDPRGDRAWLDDVELRLVGAEPGLRLEVECERAEVALATEAFRLDGRVRGVDGEGRRFRTEWLEYDPATEVLRTDAPVTVLDGGAEYRGGGLEYAIAGRRVRLLDGARVVRRAP